MPSRAKKTHSNVLTIYKASAGSGKTFTLAFEYIKLLLGIQVQDGYILNCNNKSTGQRRQSARHRNILAITFTNAATAEMKSRIVRELSRLAKIDDSKTDGETPYAAMLTNSFGCSRRDLRNTAELALNELLNDYGNFNVSTIDSFFQSILRAFSREIDHQGDYELALDRLEYIRLSVSQMLDDVNYGGESIRTSRISKWIIDFMSKTVADGKDYNLFNRNGSVLTKLTSVMDKALTDEFSKHSANLREFFADDSTVVEFHQEIAKLIEEGLDSIEFAAQDLLDTIYRADVSREDINNSLLPRLELFCSDPEEAKPNMLAIKVFDKAINNPNELTLKDILKATPAKMVDKNMPEIGYNIVAVATSTLSDINYNVRRNALLNRIDKGIEDLAFFHMALEYLEAYLRDNNTMLIADTGELLSRIISHSETPFIYERIGMTLNNMLIDEFQDTSEVQWDNLLPLVENSDTQGFDNLIIGDVKQSIYRFRGSTPSLLADRVPNTDFPAHNMRGSKVADNTNHRSSPEIVRFNNTLFDIIARRFDLPGYDNVTQTPAENLLDVHGFVEVTFHDDKTSDEAIMDKLAADIRRQHDAGYTWRDILILVRSSKDGQKIVKYFIDKYPEIQLLSNESLLLSNSSAVQTIMSLLGIVERSYCEDFTKRSEAEANGKVYYGTNNDISDFSQRYRYLRNMGLDVQEAIQLALTDQGSGVGLNGLVRKIRAENPSNLVAMIEVIVANCLSSEELYSQQAYIAALQDLAIEHVQCADPGIGAFVDAYERNSSKWAIQAASDLDAVQVMTIHISKGLERACVHIPFGDWALVKANQIWLDMSKFKDLPADIVPDIVRITLENNDDLLKPEFAPEFFEQCIEHRDADILDSINTCYVAFTRAARELCVQAGYKPPKDPNALPDFGKVLYDSIHSQSENSETTTDLNAGLVDANKENFSEEYNALEVYTLGAPSKPVKPKIAEQTFTADPYRVIFRDDARELISIDDILSDDFITGEEVESEIVDSPDGTQAMREAAERGTDLHAVLAEMNSGADLDEAIEAVGSRASWPQDLRAEYRKVLLDAFDAGGEQVAEWFSPEVEVFAERSIYDPATNRSFRPDRVVRLPNDEIAVIDYKFTTETRQSHRLQVNEYSSLINTIEKQPVCAYLWYPLLKQIIKVSSSR